jgi:hypothetical protein
MTERTTILQEVGQAFRENGLTAAITALVGGSLAVAATVTRKAFTNEAMLERSIRSFTSNASEPTNSAPMTAELTPIGWSALKPTSVPCGM